MYAVASFVSQLSDDEKGSKCQLPFLSFLALLKQSIIVSSCINANNYKLSLATLKDIVRKHILEPFASGELMVLLLGDTI